LPITIKVTLILLITKKPLYSISYKHIYAKAGIMLIKINGLQKNERKLESKCKGSSPPPCERKVM
jgi:hypothetical protein